MANITQIPRYWHNMSLRRICLKTESVDPGKNPDQSFVYVDISSVSNKSYTIWETQELLGKDAPSRARKLIRCDDIIFATVRPTLRRIAMVPAWLDGQICSTGYCVIRPDPKRLLPSYAYFYLLTEKVAQRVEAMQKGATYPAISDDDLLGLSISLPPLPEQRAIARVLRAVQAAREARQREVSLERERKAALMAHLFTHGTRGEPTKQTPIGEMPASWKVATLGDVITLQRGFDLPSQDRKPGPFPVVSSSGVFASHVVAKVAGPGVVTGRYGTIGEVFYIESDFWPLNTTLFVKEFKGNDQLFVSYFLQTINLHLLNDKTSVPGINRNAAHAIPVGLPSLVEQRDIAKILHACDAKIAALERESALLDELFRGLLEELMTGRVAVAGVLDHEVAKEREGAKHEAREARLGARHNEARS